MEHIPRPEYPRPQLMRKDWINLNGEWEFELDQSASGAERELYRAPALSGRITVPFCPESELSGVGFRDFISCVWYRRAVSVPEEWMEAVSERGDRVLLHFGAVDYAATVYVNGEAVGSHTGGYTPFTFDITSKLTPETVITLCAADDERSGLVPSGKQSGKLASYGCYYTRTTGIWQTVWLERVPKNHIRSLKLRPDLENGRVHITVRTRGQGRVTARAFFDGESAGAAEAVSAGGEAEITMDLDKVVPWELGVGGLYDLTLGFEGDEVKSYFGLRSVRLEDGAFLLNGKRVFQRLVLDQGFYPDGIYTAPSEEAIIRDIRISMDAGFNGARLHQKVFEPRFLYHCDRMGYMVWGEYANWGADVADINVLPAYLTQWTEAVERDFNHPSIVVWAPFNETWNVKGRVQRNELLAVCYSVTKLLDPTRPCVDTSGNFHVVTDIFDLHDYDQSPESFRAKYDRLASEGVLDDRHRQRQTYGGEPVMLSEYGGIKWDEAGGGWGYGNAPETMEEFISRYRGLTLALLENPRMAGFCYTQLYDVEQEKNGLYTYWRAPKFDIGVIRQINTAPAAIERDHGGGR